MEENYSKFQNKNHFTRGFSVQVSASVFLLLTAETRNLTPKTLEFGAWNLGFHWLQHSITPACVALWIKTLLCGYGLD